MMTKEGSIKILSLITPGQLGRGFCTGAWPYKLYNKNAKFLLYFGWLVGWVYGVYRPTREFFTLMETYVTIAGEGLQILTGTYGH